ncbi:MAG: hypothetical protein J6T94_06895 [Bacteroidaceae bacterium]|nr:hypothetical protein [Bacteroidaceae bacterium]
MTRIDANTFDDLIIRLSDDFQKNLKNPSRKRGDLRSPVGAAGVKLDVSALTPSSHRHPRHPSDGNASGKKNPASLKNPMRSAVVFFRFFLHRLLGMKCRV